MVTNVIPFPTIGARREDGRTYLGWAGWQQMPAPIQCVEASRLAEAEALMHALDEELGETRRLLAAFRAEVAVLRRENAELRRLHVPGVAAG